MSLTVNYSWKSSTSFASDLTTSATPTAAQLATAPASLDPDIFQSWSREGQLQYLTAKGVAPGGSLVVGPVGKSITSEIVADTALVYRGSGISGEIEEDSAGRPSTQAERDLAPTLLDARVFMSWSLEDRVAYAKAKGATNATELTIGFTGGAGQIFVKLAADVKTTGNTVYGTAGDLQPIPYHHLAGSSSGNDGAVVKASAEALFPALNGTTSRLDYADRPDGFDTINSSATGQTLASQFAGWHSAFQLEYVAREGTAGILNIPSTGTPVLTAITSATEPGLVYIVQSLQKADFAKMSKADQERIAGTAAFATIAAKIGISTVGTANFPSPIGATSNLTATQYIQQVVDNINGVTVGSVAGAKTTTRTPTGEAMPAADRLSFTRQLDILSDQIAGMGVVSPADLQAKVTAIKERFDRAMAFYDVKPATTTTTRMGNPDQQVNRYSNVISLDDNATINRGYQVFIQQEKRLADLAEARALIAGGDGTYLGKRQDVPNLVYQFQSLYNLALEAEVVIETEEINQQNELLKTYARMQEFVNRTLRSFPSVDKDTRAILGRTDVDDYYNYFHGASGDTYTARQAELKIISMFEDIDGSGQKHPLEKLRGINRPLQDMFKQTAETPSNLGEGSADVQDDHMDLNKYTHATWSALGNSLSEAVTIVNQNSQLKMNDINSLDKQRNRHFELANGALSKASEILGAIARS